jgi:signal transduction histidine kinase/ligand-binding sensor domain-containing protein
MQKLTTYRSLFYSLAAALLGVCLCVSPVRAQSTAGEAGIPIQRDFLPSEYKANQQNFSVTSDKRGLIYVANFAGVLEFDGTRWRDILTTERTKVNALATDKQGRVFVGTRGEIGYLKPDSTGDMKFVSLEKFLKKAKIEAPDVINCFTNDAGAWFVISDHIMLWNGKDLKIWAISGKITSAFMVNGRVYVALENGGLKTFSNGQLQAVTGGNTFSSLVTVNTMVSTGSGALIGSNQGIFTLDGRGITKLATKADSYFSDNIISCSAALKDGTYAFGTLKGGIVVLTADGIMQQVYSKKTSGLYNNGINYLYMDDNHGLWVATQSNITRIETPSFLNFYNQLKNVNGDVNTVVRFNNQVYVATDQGVLVYDKTDLHFKSVAGLSMAASHAVVYGNKLIIATASGVYSFDGSSDQKIADGYALFVYANGNTVYVGRLDGVSVLKNVNGQLVNSGKLAGVTDEIRGIAKDASGNLWLQQPSKGLYKYNLQAQKATLYDKANGLPYSSGNYLNPTSMGLLIGTLKGVYSYNTGKDAFEKHAIFKADSAHTNNWISKIVEDNDGNIWTTAGDGTNISLYKKINGKYVANSSALLPIQDEQVFCIYPDKASGNVWLGSTDNLISYNSKVFIDFSTIKPALIRSVTLNNDSLLFNGAYSASNGIADIVQNDFLKPTLKYDQNNLLFTFSSPSSIERNDTKFQYFLEGFDADSSQWITDRQKEYSNLSPGDYTFNVRSKNIFGVVSPEASYSFTIKKPYYQTVSAYVGYVVILTVLMIVFVRVRSKQLLQETKMLEELINERTEEVVLQKQEIENQSAELANKNDELEKINLIVKSINAEINFNSLMQSILEKTRVIRGAEKAAMLVRDKESGQFRFKASFGYDKKVLEHIHLTLEEAETRYLSFAEEAYEDIFFIKTVKSISKDNLFSHVNKAKSALMMIIRLHNQIEAFLILENWQRQNAFVQRDFSLLKNLKEHFIAAFIKTTLLEEVQNALTDLKETQDQLIRQEKLASIGQLTKGIVDRILNPLNYINNFSLLSKDLIDESEEYVEKPEISADDKEEVLDILNTVKTNLQKVNEHGVSASRIVKGMEKILREKSTDYIETDINKLISTNVEGILAEFKKTHPDVNIEVVTDFDKKHDKYKILPAEMNTVLYNLLNNALYEVIEKAAITKDYAALVKVSTKLKHDGFEIRLWDNGNGILETEMKQLFSPFFTTKPTAKGTGLGLYMSQDIIKEHKGNITVDTKVNEYTEFIITIPKKA